MNTNSTKKIKYGCFSGIFFALLGIFGFVMLMKSCTDKYDQRFKISKGLVISTNDSPIYFTLVENRNTVSFRRGGGINYTQYNTTIWIYTFNIEEGTILKKKKIININKVKNHPIETWGVYDNNVWCFINQIRAYDAITLEEKVNLKILEEKNAFLKGKFPAEHQYYEPHSEDGYIKLTALDGLIYKLDLQTLLCTEWNEEENMNTSKSYENQRKQIEKEIEENYQRNSQHYDDMKNNKISNKEYSKLNQEFYKKRDSLSKLSDSLYQLMNKTENDIRNQENYQRELKNLKEQSYFGIRTITILTDTIGENWFGLLSNDKYQTLSDYFRIESNYEETSRNTLYSGKLLPIERNNSYRKIDLTSLTQKGKSNYLQGGFLMDLNTARALRLKNPDGFYILHRDIIGDKGKLMISRIDLDGKCLWTTNTELPIELQDYTINDQYIIFSAATNSDLTAGNANSIVFINRENGSMKVYNFMRRKERN